jgi:hypothetical protein
MTLILDIKEESKVPFIMELINSFEYIEVVNSDFELSKNTFIEGMTQSFKEVKLHQAGKLKLKTAKEFIDEL